MRVSNELGAGNPKAAKFSATLTTVTSSLFGIIFAVAIIVTKNQLPKMFTTAPTVIKETSKLGYFLALVILVNSVQPVLLGNLSFNFFLFYQLVNQNFISSILQNET